MSRMTIGDNKLRYDTTKLECRAFSASSLPQTIFVHTTESLEDRGRIKLVSVKCHDIKIFAPRLLIRYFRHLDLMGNSW